MAAAPEGSNAALLQLCDRILRQALHPQVREALVASDAEQLQHRAQEALETLALSAEAGALRPAAAAAPALCSLAVECVSVAERAELSTAPARLAACGCEVLAGLLARGACDGAEWTEGWIQGTLEDLSDQLDFLALEVYCGLGRLEGRVSEAAVLDPEADDFGAYWGSLEHRQALEELAAWLVCVVLRALPSAGAAELLEFAGQDALCLCALLRGLLGCTGALPADAPELRARALEALCGLAAPQLAFPRGAPDGGIEAQTRLLRAHLELLCAAVVETGVLAAALTALRGPAAGGARRHGPAFLAFLARLTQLAAGCEASDEDPEPPPLRLRVELAAHADLLGELLEGSLTGSAPPELLGSCAALCGALSGEREDDGLTLASRALLARSLEEPAGLDPGGRLAALATLAAAAGDLEVSRPRLLALADSLGPTERERAHSRLARAGPAAGALLELLGKSDAAPVPGPAAAPAPANDPVANPVPVAASSSLRDVVQGAPAELRCALDGKLLCDPVRSPGGHVFERTTLARWLQRNGRCPVTGEPLLLEQCPRAPELRRRVSEWVRGEGRRREPRKKRAA